MSVVLPSLRMFIKICVLTPWIHFTLFNLPQCFHPLPLFDLSTLLFLLLYTLPLLSVLPSYCALLYIPHNISTIFPSQLFSVSFPLLSFLLLNISIFFPSSFFVYFSNLFSTPFSIPPSSSSSLLPPCILSSTWQPPPLHNQLIILDPGDEELYIWSHYGFKNVNKYLLSLDPGM